MLLPSPPNDILPTPMANSAPIIIMYSGRLLGRLNASSRPVTMAEPSLSVVFGFLRIYLLMAHSNSMHEATDVSVTITAPRPNT